MENELITLKQKCKLIQKDLSATSKKVVDECEEIISICNNRRNPFGEPINDAAKNEIVELCFLRIKRLNELTDVALNCVLVMYQSVMRFNELSNTNLSPAPQDMYFFSLVCEMGKAFEGLFERDIPNTLNSIADGLDLDNDGAKISLNVVISNAAKIAISVSKATKFYFQEV